MSLSRVTMATVMAIATILFHSNSYGDVLGAFTGVKNHPGYISFDKKSPFYRGNLKYKKNKKDGLERRTPSKILSEYLNSKTHMLDVQKVEKLIEGIQHYKKQAFLAYCQTKLAKYKSVSHEYGYRFCLEGQSEKEFKKIVKKFKKDQIYIGSEFVERNFKRALKLGREIELSENFLNTKEASLFLSSFFEAMEVWEGMRNEDQERGDYSSEVTKNYARVAALLLKHSIDDKRVEPSNLLIPTNFEESFPQVKNLAALRKIQEKTVSQIYFSNGQLEKLKTLGADISILSPSNSGVWREPVVPISKFNTSNYHELGYDSLVNALALDDDDDDDDDDEVDLEKGRKKARQIMDPNFTMKVRLDPGRVTGGASPKMNVRIRDQKFKLKFITNKLEGVARSDFKSITSRLLIGSEVNTESAVNNIAAAIGFTVDPTYYQHQIKFYFPKKFYKKDGDFDLELARFIESLQREFKEIVNIESAFRNIKVDEDGNQYVLLKNVLLEKKTDNLNDLNMGTFLKEGFGRTLKREHRALAMFYALIEDQDPKNANAKMKLINSAEKMSRYQDYAVAFSASDMGSAFGRGYPNYYKKKFIKKVKKNRKGKLKEINFAYKGVYKLPLFNLVSFSDAKWLSRKLMQLSRKQIYDAFFYAGHPRVVSEYYTDVFLYRFDQLIEGLGILGEKLQNDLGAEITFSKRSCISTDPELPSDYQKASCPNLYSEDTYQASNIEDQKYFKFGFLTDPKNDLFDSDKESFPRFWGTALPFGDAGNLDEKSVIEFKAALNNVLKYEIASLAGPIISESFMVSNTGVGFKGTDMNIIPFCAEGDCIFQGLQVGINGFIPYRFLVVNPYFKKGDGELYKNRYWIVDVFRLGVALVDKNASLLSELGIELPLQEFLGLKSEVSVGKEWIHITPVSTFVSSQKLQKDNHPVKKKGFSRNLLAKVKKGDILISSSYFGTENAIEFKYPLFYFINAKIGVGSEHYITKRSMTLMGEDQQLIHNVTGVFQNKVKFTAGLSALISLPVIEASVEQFKKSSHTYQFDLNDSTESGDFFKSYFGILPKTNLAPYQTNMGKISLIQRKLKISLLGILPTFKSTDRKIHMISESDGKESEFLILEKKRVKNVKMDFIGTDRDIFLTRGMIDQDGKLYTSFKFDFFYDGMMRDQLVKIYDKFKYLLPEDQILFDLNTTASYVGEFVMRSHVVLGDEGLKEILVNGPQDDTELCEMYGKINEIEDYSNWCSTIISGKFFEKLTVKKERVISFIRRFNKAVKKYRKLDKDNFDIKKKKTLTYSVLKSLVNLFSVNSLKKRTLDVLLSYVSKENFYREAKFNVEQLRAIPGRISEIVISDKYKGELELFSIFKYDDPQYYIEDITTKILDTLGGHLRFSPEL
ncbi:MAG: hypothetical protein HOE90_07305 [Bacteriovoracaceae bacterium]|nr:hypothetical protein [Bacteriovoracaceae bacterium]